MVVTSYPTTKKTDYVDTRDLQIYNFDQDFSAVFGLACLFYSVILMMILICLYLLVSTKTYEAAKEVSIGKKLF